VRRLSGRVASGSSTPSAAPFWGSSSRSELLACMARDASQVTDGWSDHILVHASLVGKAAEHLWDCSTRSVVPVSDVRPGGVDVCAPADPLRPYEPGRLPCRRRRRRPRRGRRDDARRELPSKCRPFPSVLPPERGRLHAGPYSPRSSQTASDLRDFPAEGRFTSLDLVRKRATPLADSGKAGSYSGGGTRTHNLPVNSRTRLPIELPRNGHYLGHRPRMSAV
jgi:hypothetical protein